MDPTALAPTADDKPRPDAIETAMATQSSETQWFIAREGKQYGPLSDTEMQKLVELGHLKPNDLVWRPGFSDWRPAGSLLPQSKPLPPAAHAPPSQAPAPSQPTSPNQLPRQAMPSAAMQPQSAAPTTLPRSGDPMTAGRAPAQSARPAHMSDPATARPVTQPGQAPGYQSPQPGGQPQMQPYTQPYAAPAQQGTALTAGRRPQATESGEHKLPDISEETTGATRGRKRTLAAAAIVLMVAAGAGLLLSKKGGFMSVANVSSTDAAPTSSAVAPLGGLSDSTDAIDASFQRTPLWVLVKREFPEWYGERLKDVARLNAEKQPEDAVAKRLAEALVSLRRQHADKALAASTPKLKGVASAFLGNLKALAAKSTDACYNFISQGETSPAVIEMMRSPDQNSPAQMQVAAIFEAIAEGRKSPVSHSAPVKSDYDALADQLTKLGWTQADLQLFADSKSLAKAKPDKVCKMVQDWFVAHIGIQDAAVQERLLVETLRPVVAG